MKAKGKCDFSACGGSATMVSVKGEWTGKKVHTPVGDVQLKGGWAAQGPTVEGALSLTGSIPTTGKDEPGVSGGKIGGSLAAASGYVGFQIWHLQVTYKLTVDIGLGAEAKVNRKNKGVEVGAWALGGGGFEFGYAD